VRHLLRAAPPAAGRPGRATRVVAVAMLAAVALVGCTKDQADPAQERRDRLEQRLRSFSAAESNCILRRLDDATMRALDRTAALTGGSKAQKAYTDAVVACVTDPTGTTTTAGAPAATTTTTAGG